jgi:rRNA-processing protein FCF1
VVHAEDSGDDALIDVVARNPDQSITLVTADRELRRRAQARGAVAVGPGWLFELLR